MGLFAGRNPAFETEIQHGDFLVPSGFRQTSTYRLSRRSRNAAGKQPEADSGVANPELGLRKAPAAIKTPTFYSLEKAPEVGIEPTT